jgi:hypothetical protein
MQYKTISDMLETDKDVEKRCKNFISISNRVRVSTVNDLHQGLMLDSPTILGFKRFKGLIY